MVTYRTPFALGPSKGERAVRGSTRPSLAASRVLRQALDERLAVEGLTTNGVSDGTP